MIDTHTHLYEQAFDADGGGKAAVMRAVESGVRWMVMPNVDCATVKPLCALADECPGHIFPAMGLHPTSVDHEWETVINQLRPLFENRRFVAVGEVGIDLYWDKSYREEQMRALARQIEWGLELKLPVIIHCREALDETLEVLEGFGGKLPPLVFHSFTSGPQEVDRIRRVADPMFGVNGVVTYKNAGALREAIPHIGPDRILLETDSPYLAPVPHRGRRNESALLPYVLSEVANALGITRHEAECLTDANASGFFPIPMLPI